MSDSRYFWIAGLLFLILITGPYLYGFLTVDGDFLFNGFLLNPLDGNSYLAKIELGNTGFWKFSLPYTAEKSAGGYLFLFYLLLGHIGRVLGMENIIIFHTARIVSSLAMLVSLNFYFRSVVKDPKVQKWAFITSLFGSGMGWIAITFGYFTSDFWVAEIYPFLSAYTNPHFPLGLAILLMLLAPGGIKNHYLKALSSALLAVIQPFAAVIGITVTGVEFLVGYIKEIRSENSVAWKRKEFLSLGSIVFGAGPVLVFQYLVIHKDPILNQWNGQNITPSPEPLDMILSLSPMLILAVPGSLKAWNDKRLSKMVIWAMTGLGLAIVPWQLQRRFLTGLFVPLSGLAVLGLRSLKLQRFGDKSLLILVLIIFSLPTNLIVILSGVDAISRNDNTIVYSADLEKVFEWVENNTSQNEIILTDERNGNLIPAYTGRRVLYGHPFETVNSDRMKDIVQEFFAADTDPSRKLDIINNWHVDYILIESDMNQIRGIGQLSRIQLHFELDQYSVFEVIDSGASD